jgi:hypothetical protein
VSLALLERAPEINRKSGPGGGPPGLSGRGPSAFTGSSCGQGRHACAARPRAASCASGSSRALRSDVTEFRLTPEREVASGSIVFVEERHVRSNTSLQRTRSASSAKLGPLRARRSAQPLAGLITKWFERFASKRKISPFPRPQMSQSSLRSTLRCPGLLRRWCHLHCRRQSSRRGQRPAAWGLWLLEMHRFRLSCPLLEGSSTSTLAHMSPTIRLESSARRLLTLRCSGRVQHQVPSSVRGVRAAELNRYAAR